MNMNTFYSYLNSANNLSDTQEQMYSRFENKKSRYFQLHALSIVFYGLFIAAKL